MPNQFFHICNAIPFGTDFQIIIIIDLITSKKNKKKIEKWDDDLDIVIERSLEIPKHSEVIFDFSPELASNNFIQKLAYFGEVFVFENLKGQKLINWATKRAKDKGLKIAIDVNWRPTFWDASFTSDMPPPLSVCNLVHKALVYITMLFYRPCAFRK